MYLQEQKISLLTLRFFDVDLEKEFIEDHFQRTLRYVRGLMLFGIFLYSIFGILDAYVIPEAKHKAWAIRYGIFVPYSILAVMLSYLKSYRRYMHVIMITHASIAGFGIIGMLLLAKPPGSSLYYAGLMLVIIYIYTMIKLRFIYAIIASWAIVLVYGLTAVMVSREPFTILLSNSFFLFSANLLGMIACYQIERYIRTDFLQRRLIRELEEKRRIIEKEKILKDLHDGVGGIATSISLLAEMARNESSIEEVRKALGSIFELSRESLTEIRGFMQSLDVRELEWDTLVADLRHLGNNLLEARGIRFTLSASYSGARGRPDTLLYLNLFRIYKEALTNIIKHARARVVTVILDITAERLQLSVQDDGEGLRQEWTGGRGMASMRDRARELGGSLSVEPGPGTNILVDVPLPVKYLSSGMETPSSP